MLNVKGNAWDVYNDYDVLCITTNGFVKNNGECVMGRGIALEAKKRFPSIAKVLGSFIKQYGNRCMKLAKIKDTYLVSFPVKHNWYEMADIELIKRSCLQLTEMADKFNWTKILLPRPGCGNGGLNWNDVEPIISELLDDRFYIITF